MTKEQIIKYIKNYKEIYERMEKDYIEKYGDNFDDRSLQFIRDTKETYIDIYNNIIK